jgi:hypothetical protein
MSYGFHVLLILKDLLTYVTSEPYSQCVPCHKFAKPSFFFCLSAELFADLITRIGKPPVVWYSWRIKENGRLLSVMLIALVEVGDWQSDGGYNAF